MQFVEKKKRNKKRRKENRKRKKKKEKEKKRKKRKKKRKENQSSMIMSEFALHYRVKDQSASAFSVIREKTKLAQSRLNKLEDSALSIIS